MLRDNLVELIEPMLNSAGADPLALYIHTRTPASDDRLPCLKNPRPEGAESSLTESASSPFQAEPAHLIYAQSMLAAGSKYSEAIAVVKLSSTQGLEEPRYIATLGGMLFMNGDFSQATEVFEESKKQELSASERNQVHFWAVDLTDRTK